MIFAYTSITMAHSQVEQIKERLDILEVIGAYVELHKAGRHYKGKSPFTSEKTPSFFVSPDRGMYYCFSSQKGGDIFTFIQEMEGVDFKGALKILAEKAGVELVAEDPKKRDERDTQYALLEAAAQFFFKAREAHPAITEYVEGRGVTGETEHIWRIGYAPDEWRALRTHLAELKFTDSEMLKAGLIKSVDGGKEPYDVFRDRVMFPIMDPSGRAIAFSGRTMKKEDGVPKYVNSPETTLFQKSEVLYGYDKAKHGIRKLDFSLIVEGQFDVVLTHQAGYTNAVAVSGTALTPHHISLLGRLSHKVVLALDADRAGISAVKRSAALMLRKGMDVKVAGLPDGKDPADIVREDPKELKRIVGNAETVVEFLLGHLKKETKDARAYQLQTREEIVPLIASIPNRIDRAYFEQVVAERVGTTVDAIHYEVERVVEDGERKQEKEEERVVSAHAPAGSLDRKSDLVIHLHTLSDILKGSPHDAVGQAVYAHLLNIISEDDVLAILERSGDAAGKSIFTNEEYIESVSPQQLKQDVESTLTRLAHIVARERLTQLRAHIAEAEAGGDTDHALKLLEAVKEAEVLLKEPVTLGV